MRLNFRNLSFAFALLFSFCQSCKKEEIIESSGIIGPTQVCFGEQGVEYSINFSNPVDYVIWSVPEGSEIVSGQGTTKIIVNFGSNEGQIEAQVSNNNTLGKSNSIAITFGCFQDIICRIKDFPGSARKSVFSFSTGNKAYVGGGYGYNAASGSFYSDFTDLWEFDGTTETWSQKADFSNITFGIYNSNNSFVINSDFYVITSGLGISGNSTQCYSPQTNTWTSKADFPGNNYYGSACFTAAGKGYICCGDGNSTTVPIGASYYSQKVYEYNAQNDTWTNKNDFIGSSRTYTKGFSIGADGYLAGGENLIENGAIDNYSTLSDVWKYNPVNDSWIQQNNLPNSFPYSYSKFVGMDNCAYLLAGDYSNIAKVYKFKPAENNVWKEIIDLNNKFTYGLTAFRINDKIYFGQGEFTQTQIGNPYSNRMYKFCVEQ